LKVNIKFLVFVHVFLKYFDFVYSDDFLAHIERIYDFLVGNSTAFPRKSCGFYEVFFR